MEDVMAKRPLLISMEDARFFANLYLKHHVNSQYVTGEYVLDDNMNALVPRRKPFWIFNIKTKDGRDVPGKKIAVRTIGGRIRYINKS